MKKIMKLFATIMVVTLLVLAASLAQARTMHVLLQQNSKLQTNFKLTPIPSKPISPPPNQEPKKSVQQFPVPIYCPPGKGRGCISPGVPGSPPSS